jgi:hypothetical protein
MPDQSVRHVQKAEHAVAAAHVNRGMGEIDSS